MFHYWLLHERETHFLRISRRLIFAECSTYLCLHHLKDRGIVFYYNDGKLKYSRIHILVLSENLSVFMPKVEPEDKIYSEKDDEEKNPPEWVSTCNTWL